MSTHRTDDRHFSSIGAVITVLALAMDPFIQQIASYGTREAVADDPSTLKVAWIAHDDGTSIARMKAAFYKGVSDFGALKVEPTCPTGSCTWSSPYSTLAVCSRCFDITDQIRKLGVGTCVSMNASQCEWSLPNGLTVQPGQFVNASGELLSSNTIGIPIANFSMLNNGDSASSNSSFLRARECSLFWCINTYFASIISGSFHEHLLSSTPNRSGPASPPTGLDEQNVWIYPDAPFTKQSSVQKNTTKDFFNSDGLTSRSPFWISSNYSARLSKWLSSELTIEPAASSDTLVTLESYYTLAKLDSVFSSIANSMTVALRQGPTDYVADPDHSIYVVKGTTWAMETYLHVRWAWITLPVCLVLLSSFFLVATIISSRQKDIALWKSSTLPLLFNHVPFPGPAVLGAKVHVADMEEVATRMKVQMQESSITWRLERKIVPA